MKTLKFFAIISVSLVALNSKAQDNKCYTGMAYLFGSNAYDNRQTTLQGDFYPISGISLSGGYALRTLKRISFNFDVNYTTRGTKYLTFLTTGNIISGPPPQFEVLKSSSINRIHTLGLNAQVRLNYINKEKHQLFIATGLKPNFVMASSYKQTKDSEISIDEIYKTYQEKVLLDVPINLLGYKYKQQMEVYFTYNFPLLELNNYFSKAKNHYIEFGLQYYFNCKGKQQEKN